MRRPIAASGASPIPTLAAMLAGAAASQGCAHVECGETRADELRAHGAASVDALRQGRVRDGLREIAVATGARAHDVTEVPEVHRAGEQAPVTVTPPLAPDPARSVRGGVSPVGVTMEGPTSQPAPPPRIRRPPRARDASPVRPPTVTAGAPMPVGPGGD